MAPILALTCTALARSVYAAAATSPYPVSVKLLDQGLHNRPKGLRERLQDEIDAVPESEYGAIILAYGVCGLGTVGLTARTTPLVLPRAHDCITLYLGSRERYNAEFDSAPGTYWYSVDFLEHLTPGSHVALGAASIETTESVYEEYVAKYGKENADYLMEVMGEWGKHYTRAAFLDTGLGDPAFYEQKTREQAERRGWRYEKLAGDRRLIVQLVHGQWNDDEFLVVPPGYRIAQTADAGIVAAEPPSGEPEA